jgi:hypothetical protein
MKVNYLFSKCRFMKLLVLSRVLSFFPRGAPQAGAGDFKSRECEDDNDVHYLKICITIGNVNDMYKSTVKVPMYY